MVNYQNLQLPQEVCNGFMKNLENTFLWNLDENILFRLFLLTELAKYFNQENKASYVFNEYINNIFLYLL